MTWKLLQGIDWHRLHQRRDDYRAERLAQYRNYTNVIAPVLQRYKNLRQFHEGGVRLLTMVCITSHANPPF